MEQTAGGTTFVTLATTIAFISFRLPFSEFLQPSILREAKALSQSGPIP